MAIAETRPFRTPAPGSVSTKLAVISPYSESAAISEVWSAGDDVVIRGTATLAESFFRRDVANRAVRELDGHGDRELASRPDIESKLNEHLAGRRKHYRRPNLYRLHFSFDRRPLRDMGIEHDRLLGEEPVRHA